MDAETKNERRMLRGGGRAYRSRLEPFTDFIREQRQQRQSWLEIAALLRTEHGCAITFQGLHQFYRRYLKRQARPHWESKTAESTEAKPQATTRKPGHTSPPTETETTNKYEFNTDINI
jgi:hypothetical protein